MTNPFDKNIMTTLAGLNLALSYENAAVERLEKRLSESTDPEIKQKLNRHLTQTREQQERLRERITALGEHQLLNRANCLYHNLHNL